MKNILVIQTAFLGDVVLATAVIEKLHACLPDASISMLVRKGNESLLKNHPFLKKVIVWDKTKNKIPNLLHTIGEIKKENFDTVINLQRFFSSGLFTIFSGAKTKIWLR
jgi:ADP-heptose:LPS heptosyltransferase